MHGDDHFGLQIIDQRLGLFGADGVVATYGNHGNIQVEQVSTLERRQGAAKVPKVGHPELPHFQQMNGIGPPQFAPSGSWKVGISVMWKGLSCPVRRETMPAAL